VQAEIWSVTSWVELRRDALEVDRANFLNPTAKPKVPFVTQQLESAIGPIIAVSDYMRQVPDQIRQWVKQDFYSLGTDGWGMSDTRGALRRHFLVDAESITVQALAALAAKGAIPAEQVTQALTEYQLADPKAADAGNTEGTG